MSYVDPSKRKTVMSLKALAVKTGIDIKIIRKCKHLNADGFNTNNSVNVDRFLAWYEANKDKIDAIPSSGTTLDELKIQDKQMDIRLKKLKERELEKTLIEPQEVKALLVELATKQSIVLKKIFNELKPKLSGKSESDITIILDENLQIIFNVLQEKINSIK